jgi:hypothetical protein
MLWHLKINSNLFGKLKHEADCLAKPWHQPETASVGGIRERQHGGKRGRYPCKELGARRLATTVKNKEPTGT